MQYKKLVLYNWTKGKIKNIEKKMEKLSSFADRMIYLGNLKQSAEMWLEIKRKVRTLEKKSGL